MYNEIFLLIKNRFYLKVKIYLTWLWKFDMDKIALKEILFVNATDIRKNIQLTIFSAKDTGTCITTSRYIEKLCIWQWFLVKK